jgi:hypothetical protein
MCEAAALTGDRGDGGTPIEFFKGGTVYGAQSGLRVSAEGGGTLERAGGRRGGRAWKKIEGEEGGLAASQAVGGKWLGTWRGEKMGPGQWREM